jgi:hypothetical protein
MTFDDILTQVLDLLQREGRVAYWALMVRFQLDDDLLEVIKDELIYAKKRAVDEDNRVLVWGGEQASAAPSPAPATLALAAGPSTAQDRVPLPYTPQHLAEKILTSSSALEGERKQVPVLFADVAGFTALAEQLDPEVVHDMINRCFEGTINQYTGYSVRTGATVSSKVSARCVCLTRSRESVWLAWLASGTRGNEPCSSLR